ncbi:MAG: hypothetical protein ACPGXX_19145, partial [Planctomycetaceae bacterium]
MRLLLVSDDDSYSKRVQDLLYERGLEFSQGDRFRTADIAGLIQRLSNAAPGTPDSVGAGTTIILVMPVDRELGVAAVAQICEQ